MIERLVEGGLAGPEAIQVLASTQKAFNNPAGNTKKP
jgi:hypothetical protein